ncbi:MAG: DeoR/GlpR transcriptional regulator [Anaerolineae bacterium]|nr:DeoR/GlpR transcriptional regulator [Anaerolineae bacterium]
MELLTQSGSVSVTDLAAHFSVDPVTIRRDLATLETTGRLHRVHGGAILREGGPDIQPATEIDRRIAETAVRMIATDHVVFLGPGTLTGELVAFLSDHEQLTLITNGLNVAWRAFHSRIPTLHLVGGQVERDMGIYGNEPALSRIRADWVILEAGGLDAERGLTHDDVTYAGMARALFHLGAQVMVVLPPERVGRAGAVFIAPADAVDVLVTGREAADAPLWDLSEIGLRVVLT